MKRGGGTRGRGGEQGSSEETEWLKEWGLREMDGEMVLFSMEPVVQALPTVRLAFPTTGAWISLLDERTGRVEGGRLPVPEILPWFFPDLARGGGATAGNAARLPERKLVSLVIRAFHGEEPSPPAVRVAARLATGHVFEDMLLEELLVESALHLVNESSPRTRVAWLLVALEIMSSVYVERLVLPGWELAGDGKTWHVVGEPPSRGTVDPASGVMSRLLFMFNDAIAREPGAFEAAARDLLALPPDLPFDTTDVDIEWLATMLADTISHAIPCRAGFPDTRALRRNVVKGQNDAHLAVLGLLLLHRASPGYAATFKFPSVHSITEAAARSFGIAGSSAPRAVLERAISACPVLRFMTIPWKGERRLG